MFDRPLARRRLARVQRAFAGDGGADFLLRRAAGDLADRLSLVKRQFGVAVDLATPGPHAAWALAGDARIGFVLRAAPTACGAGEGAYARAVVDEERSPLGDQRSDLIVSLLALQGVNDLPGALIQIRRALKPDGLFLGCVIGGETLNELRQSLTAAESEIRFGASPRVAPFADVRALGALLQRAGFALPVVDLDRVVTPLRRHARADARSARDGGDQCARRPQPRGATPRRAGSRRRNLCRALRRWRRAPARYV